MPKKDTQHRLRIRKFVRTNFGISVASQSAAATETPSVETNATTQLPAAKKLAPILIKQRPNNIPLFMETLFKAKEYDPL